MSFAHNPTQAHLAAKADNVAALAKAEENAGHHRAAEYAHKKASELYQAAGEVGKSISESMSVTRENIKADMAESHARFHQAPHSAFFASSKPHYGATHSHDAKPSHCHAQPQVHCHPKPAPHCHKK